ncbi:MAG: aminotransferase class I/II-fold pyridoxal phosphate-dependent enzyme [Microbacteriaceae bacterium]|nr:aminotransferase class I/II-fold pyridoxal phosphate-dependent enzyme [Microbacteriaceae bacterium]
MQPSKPRLETRAVHGGMEGVEESGSHVPTIDLSTTNPLPTVEIGGDSYEHMASGGTIQPGQSAVYQRLWQPGVARFETALADLEGAESAVAFATGMAALSAVLLATVLGGKPHIVGLRPLYGGSDYMLDNGVLGTTVTWAHSIEEIADAITPNTGLVIIESPANPTLELVNIARVVKAAGDVPVLVDNTFATPVLQRPIEHGATLVLHSATKYIGGHGDVMGGVIATSEEWAHRIRPIRALTGGILHPFAAYLLHRGLRTMPLRVRAQQATAQELAERLNGHKALARVLFPSLPGLDPEGLLGTQAEGPGAMLSLDIAGGFSAAAKFIESLKLVSHAVSLGGVDTLAEHPASLTHRVVTEEAKPGGGIVRFSLGLEHVDDIYEDIIQALKA